MAVEPVEGSPDSQLQLIPAALEFEKARADSLAAAVASNRRIGIAVGLVMTQLDLGDDDAFEVLRRVSMNTNRRLAELAEDVINLRKLTSGTLATSVGRLGDCPPRGAGHPAGAKA